MGSSLEESLKINTSELSIIYAILFSDLFQSKQVHATKTRLHRHEACRAKLEGRYFPFCLRYVRMTKDLRKTRAERETCALAVYSTLSGLGKKIKKEWKKRGEYSWGIVTKDTAAVGRGNSQGPFTSIPDSVSGLRATAQKTNSYYQAFVDGPQISFLIMLFLSQRRTNCWEYSKAKRVPFLPCSVAFREPMWPSHQAML